MVEFDVLVKDPALFDGKLETLVGVIVSDNTPNEELGERLESPDFASKVFLENDIALQNFHFQYSRSYFDHIFQPLTFFESFS